MTKILVVDDEPFITDMVEATLVAEGYEVNKAYSGEDALISIQVDPPDLVLLDLMLPGMSGYEVSRFMQREAFYSHIPIIMVTARSGTHDRSSGYETGADDYITKPFNSDELLIRVRAQLHHAHQTDFSKLTGLPGSRAVQAAIQKHTKSNKPWSIIYADIENFTSYNEVYSFQKGDHVLRKIADILKHAASDKGNKDDFVGYAGRDDFVIITTPSHTDALIKRAEKLFKEVIDDFFNDTDRKNGYFSYVNHAGLSLKLPLMSLSFDVVDNGGD
ncbi:response regulator [Candidatus Chlorohelix sp.]|uniref:GGDEF domain-containing response regulator n=1 Tax=Candidatus Chlorohelix sp. TaxID=3139201 RepID=UPI00303890D2